MRRLAALLALGVMLVPTAATACGNLTALGRQREADREARYLEGARVVEGRWQLEREGEDDFRAGSIHLRWGRHETGRSLHAYFGEELNCGFPLFPQDTAVGRFYLRRSGRDSWTIIHFEADPRQAAATLEETTP